MHPQAEPRKIVITGDLTIDWNLISYQKPQESTSNWDASRSTRACPQPGGVALLSDLIARLVEGLPVEVFGATLPAADFNPADGRTPHSYASWALVEEKGQKAWRVAQYLGMDTGLGPVQAPDKDDETPTPGDDPGQADLVVLDDANLGFRDHPGRWPKALSNPENPPWVLLKLSGQIGQNRLLSELNRLVPGRVVAVVSANNLRLANAQISRGLSWERVAQDTLWEFSYGSDLKELAKCAHVVVTFSADGAALISRVGEGLKCSLFFDANTIENGWTAGYRGGMVGYHTCLAAALAYSLLAAPPEDAHSRVWLGKGIQAGFSAMRALHKQGYEVTGASPRESRIAFPVSLVAGEIQKPDGSLAWAEIRDPLGGLASSRERKAGKFTILAEQCCDDLPGLAREIVKKGPDKVLTNIPLGRFGKLITVDRNEIESYRTIAALIQEYLSQEKMEKPVSIAVFGAPGSGKSFGIKEIANSLSDRIKEITFNLSQMTTPSDLTGALHQVRDESLRGKIPLVFWDEFDSKLQGTALGWLSSFLAPMQDGSFLEGQVTHPIGRAIFVFAGGTCERMEEFGAGLDADPQVNAGLFKAVKGPDFKSRLKGFINILGPNPRPGDYDPYFIIRRAILLHSLLKRSAPQIYARGFDMDDNLLDAFLETQVFLHGVRSMESIIAMSQLAGKNRFERSCLPPISQLNLHVIGWEFMARVQKLRIEGEALEVLAQAVHEDFCLHLAEQGFVFGPQTDEDANPPTHSSLRPYAGLPAGEKNQNELYALSIPAKLAGCGYVMIHARTNEPPLIFPDNDLDRLAKEEHIRWVKAKIAQDSRWHYAPQTDKARFEHSCLLPWEKVSESELAGSFSAAERSAMGREALPETEKAKDRILIRRIPSILSRVGYTVIKLDDAD